MKKDYYLGLDIGTNSVGWAVTDTEYNLCRFKGKDMWGIRLFESAETAAERRIKRGNRRRLQRRNERIKLIQMLFAEEMQKVDPTFFIRLNESSLYPEDKTIKSKHVLFMDKNYTDTQYYNDYPTIYHLRKALLKDDGAKDIRLVYLAIHHIMKSRGHFLIDGSLAAAKDFNETLSKVIDDLGDTPIGLEIKDIENIEDTLKAKGKAKSDKAREIEKLLVLAHEDEDKAILKLQKSALKELCKMIVGNQADIKKLFYWEIIDVEENLLKFKFSDSKYDEQLVPELESNNPEILNLIERIKTIYDWSVLVDILNGEEYISIAKVKQFKKHKENLKSLKYLFKKYLTKEEYNTFFVASKEGATYANYINAGRNRGQKKTASDEEFYKNLRRIITNIGEIVSEDDKELLARISVEAESETLLPLQRSKRNSVIPKQVHEHELETIIKNAEKYHPFLKEKDDNGIAVSEKILKTFNYRIPYFVGPLSDRHKDKGANTWSVRKEDGYIYPWNIDAKIDREKSNEAFITRMTNKCTYLPWEDVLPKNSLLYQRYMVLNELNNLTIRGNKLGDNVELKQRIYHDLFEKHHRITGKLLLGYLQKDDPDLTLDLLGGFDMDFKASLSSQIEFRNKVFGDRINERHIQEICEDVIKWGSIYGNDTRMLEEVVKKEYGNELTEEEIKAIKSMRFSGWGQFSKAFLNDLEGVDRESGEVFSIMGGLWNTNNNLMQLLSTRFTFEEKIKELKAENMEGISSFSYEEVFKNVYTSPANKRSIWQALQIVEELRKVMGCQPKKIFVEMARGEEKEKKRTISRKQALINLYEACKDDTHKWMLEEIKERDERDFNSKKLYLYYTQMGMCAYSGEKIDLDLLMSNNSKWDRDHIYPQSKIKDDSFDNMVLANKYYNGEKDNKLIPREWQKKMQPTWKMWLDKGFISQKKYDRLIRKEDFSVDELSGFIARQLVETRQSTKIVADLLENLCKDSKVIRVKAGLVSDFRKTPLNALKSRRVNDYHHAKDAYLNIVVGNVYSVRFTDNPREWVKKNRNENWSINKVFYFNVEGAWIAPSKDKGDDGKYRAIKNEQGDICSGSIDVVRKTMRKNSVLYTEYTYCDNGGLFNETIQKKGKPGIIPIKKGMPTEKYGGYISPSTSYFAQVEFDGRKGDRIKNIIGVPIYVANMLEHNPKAFLEYCQDKKGMKNVRILISKIKKNSLIIVDGFPMRIRGENENNLLLKSNLQLIVDPSVEETIRKIEKAVQKRKQESITSIDHISTEELARCYKEFLLKLTVGAYRKRPSNQAKNLEKGEEHFALLDDISKAIILNEILNMLRCDITTTGDLRKIGGSANAGALAINKNTVGKANVQMLNQSVTGLFENRIEL